MIPALAVGSSAQNPSRAVSRRTGGFHDKRLDESSGVVASRRHPGLLWTLNDSGGDPVLFLTDTTGAALGSIRSAGQTTSIGRRSAGARAARPSAS
jgi:hypothetical protein